MAGNPAPFLQAAQKYGSNPHFNQWALKTYGVSGPVLLAKVAKGESGFDMGAVSSAGARAGTQFMPATRQEFIAKYGVDPWASPDQAIHATELYLSHDSRGLAGYNPGDPGYTKYILSQKVPGAAGARVAVQPAAVATPAGGTNRTVTLNPGVDNSGLRQQLVSQFLGAGGVKSSNASLAFAQGIQGAQDVPATRTVTTAPASGVRVPAGPQTRAKTGMPVADLTSTSGLHQTEGLPGYPAHDYFAPAGSPTVAPISGRVVRLSGHDPRLGPIQGPHGPLGWSVYIQGTDGRLYYLTHMGTRTVKEGQRVRQGQQIGTVANYQKYGTPSHIHMGVHG